MYFKPKDPSYAYVLDHLRGIDIVHLDTETPALPVTVPALDEVQGPSQDRKPHPAFGFGCPIPASATVPEGTFASPAVAAAVGQ